MWHFRTVPVSLHWVPTQSITRGGGFRNSSVSWLQETPKFLTLNFWSVELLQRGEDFLFSRRTNRNGQGEGKSMGFFFPVLVCHSVVCPGENASYVSLKGGEAWMLLPSCAIGFSETSRYVIFSRPPLWAAQFYHVPRLWLAVPHQEKCLKVVSLPLQNGFGIFIVIP